MYFGFVSKTSMEEVEHCRILMGTTWEHNYLNCYAILKYKELTTFALQWIMYVYIQYAQLEQGHYNIQ